MNTVLKYVIWLDLLNCHALEKMTLEVAIFGNFPDIPELKLSLPPEHSTCTFCKRKTRGETQFLMELAAPCTFANLYEINSDETLLFIIFLTPVFCDGSNRLWRQRLLLSPCFL